MSDFQGGSCGFFLMLFAFCIFCHFQVPQGGWFTLVVAAVVAAIIFVWWNGSTERRRMLLESSKQKAARNIFVEVRMDNAPSLEHAAALFHISLPISLPALSRSANLSHHCSSRGLPSPP